MQEFDRYVFNDIPIRMIWAPKMQLVERSFIAQHYKSSIVSYVASNHPDPLANSRPVKLVKYAVLSHRWLRDTEEVTKDDFDKIAGGSDPTLKDRKRRGWEKLNMFCKEAIKRKLEFVWADTCCIDKSSSAELDESIRSMFRWYRNSALCIVLLAQTRGAQEARDATTPDEWFSRGWTLQELLAPRRVKFYGSNWNELTYKENDKDWFRETPPRLSFVMKATGISAEDLADFKPGPTSVDDRMCWAAKRLTTRGEDVAYSLMGIFDVSIPTAYGEGADRAFVRLVEAIMLARGDTSVLNWAGQPARHHGSRYLPASPASYLNHPTLRDTYTNINLTAPRHLALTSKGLQVSLVVFHVKHSTAPQGDVLLHPLRPPGGPRRKSYFHLVLPPDVHGTSSEEERIPLHDVLVDPQEQNMPADQTMLGMSPFPPPFAGFTQGAIDVGSEYALGLIWFLHPSNTSNAAVFYKNSGVLLQRRGYAERTPQAYSESDEPMMFLDEWRRVVTGYIPVDLSRFRPENMPNKPWMQVKKQYVETLFL